jgi:hypothetical protein
VNASRPTDVDGFVLGPSFPALRNDRIRLGGQDWRLLRETHCEIEDRGHTNQARNADNARDDPPDNARARSPEFFVGSPIAHPSSEAFNFYAAGLRSGRVQRINYAFHRTRELVLPRYRVSFDFGLTGQICCGAR